MNPRMVRLDVRCRAIEKTVPLLQAIRGVAEMALHRGHAQVEPAHVYAGATRALLRDVLLLLTAEERDDIWPNREHGPCALLVLSSERGLCGLFNVRIVRAALDRARSLRSDGRAVELLCLGQKGQRLLRELGADVAYGAPLPSLASPTYLQVEHVALDLLDLVEKRGYARVEAVRHVPGGRLSSRIVVSALWPPPAPECPNHAPRTDIRPADDMPALLAHLLAEDLLMGLYEAMIESFVSEQQARVIAMQLAAESANRLVLQLTRELSAERKNSITSSLLEIISGREATLEADGLTAPS